MQVAQRNLEVAYFHTGYYDRRVAELRDRLRAHPGRSRSALGARARLRRHRRREGGGRRVQRDPAVRAERRRRDRAARARREGERRSREGAVLARARARARRQEPARASVHRRGALQPRAQRPGARALYRSIELSPDNADAHYLIGFVLGDIGRHEEARAATKRAIQLNPSLSRAQANLSIDRYNSARYNELVPARQERRSSALELSTDGHLAHYNLGLAFRQKGYYAEALKEYKLALERNEDANLVRQAMAEVHLLKKDAAPRSSCTIRSFSRSRTRPSSGASAASRCISRGSMRRLPRAISRALALRSGVRDRAQQSGRRAVSRRRRRRSRSTRSAQRSRRSRPS